MSTNKGVNQHKPGADIRFKLIIGDAAIGPGKIRLLEKIRQLGSVSAAARHMDMNVRRAQYLIKTLNDTLGRDVLETASGGRKGGHSMLSGVGKHLIRQYHQIDADIRKVTNGHLQSLPDALLEPVNDKDDT